MSRTRITCASHHDGHTVEAVARLTGVDVSRLRIWELRYGWPNPRRAPNGYRCYSDQEVAAIRRMRELLDERDGQGQPRHTLASLIVGGMPRWPDAPPLAPDFTRLHALPRPQRELGERYQRLVRTAVSARLTGHLQMLLIEAACLVHPLDRTDAAWLPTLLGLAAWDAVGRPCDDAEALRQFIRDQVGADAMAAMLERVGDAS